MGLQFYIGALAFCYAMIMAGIVDLVRKKVGVIMAFRPLGDRVLVVLSSSEEVSAGGIFIPSTAQEKPQTAVVVAVGPGRVTDNGALIEPRVKTGDVVLLPKYAGTEIRIEGKDHIVLSESDIVAVVER